MRPSWWWWLWWWWWWLWWCQSWRHSATFNVSSYAHVYYWNASEAWTEANKPITPQWTLAGNWGRRYWQHSHLQDHESPLGIERQRHSCSLLLGAKLLWHRGEIVGQLAKEALDHDIDPLTTVHFADLKPMVYFYIQQEVQIKWDASIHGRDMYLLKPIIGPPKIFRHLTRAEEVVITRLWIGHTKATKSHILSRGPPTACQHCGQTLTIEHMLLECTVLQQSRDEYYIVDSLRTLFETTPEACIIEFLREAGFFYLIWMAIYLIQLFIQISHQLTTFSSWINPHYWTPPLYFVYRA